MNKYSGICRCAFSLMLCLILFYPSHARTEESPGQEGLGDESILFQEIPSVYGASKYEQKITEAPSSVSIITSSEIQKYGYRTLAEILRSVGGFYITYDRNYSYVGARGFNRPGDYNTRLLLLVDGHRTNDNIFDQAFIGNDFIIDVDIIDRVEIIRGPGSSLYGSNAFFGIINVITKRGRELQGIEASGEAGSFRAYKGRLSYGTKFSGGAEMIFSGTAYYSHGQEHLFFKEFDSPESNKGVAEDADADRFESLFTKLTYSGFTLSGAYISRKKNIPTAPFGTVFNNPDTTVDRRGYIDLKYQHSFEHQWDLLARMYYDYYSFDGKYIFDNAEPGDPRLLVANKDESRGQWMGGELKVSKKLDRHNLTLGAEYLKNFEQDQKNFDEDPRFLYFKDEQGSSNWALYFQDEISVLKNLILNAGIRYDYYDTFGENFSPRVGLIYNPIEKTTVKLLYGEAFRAPNAFEKYYTDGNITSEANPGLEPEKIKTYELVLDQYIGDHLLITAAGFYYKINNLITQAIDASNGLIQYQNAGTVNAKGFELELDSMWPGGLEGRASYTLQYTGDENGSVLSNSPRHLVKFNLLVPLVREKIFTGMEVQYTSSRKTLSGFDTDSYVIANLTVCSRNLIKGLEASASVYNIFDKKYADPGSSEHLQNTIEQDGRTFRVKLTYAF